LNGVEIRQNMGHFLSRILPEIKKKKSSDKSRRENQFTDFILILFCVKIEVITKDTEGPDGQYTIKDNVAQRRFELHAGL